MDRIVSGLLWWSQLAGIGVQSGDTRPHHPVASELFRDQRPEGRTGGGWWRDRGGRAVLRDAREQRQSRQAERIRRTDDAAALDARAARDVQRGSVDDGRPPRVRRRDRKST